MIFPGLAPQKSNIILSGEVHQQVSHHLLLDRQHSKPMQCFLSLFPEISNNPTSTLLLVTKPNSPLILTSVEKKTYFLQNHFVCFVKDTVCADGPFWLVKMSSRLIIMLSRGTTVAVSCVDINYSFPRTNLTIAVKWKTNAVFPVGI